MQGHNDSDGIGGIGDAVRGSNQTGVRAHNERLVLTLIRRLGPLAKSDISRRSGLSSQTVSVIMRALEADGLLHKGKPVRGKVGQPSVPMGLSADGSYFLGLKIGRRSADLVLVDFLGCIIQRQHQTYRYPVPDDTLAFARDAAARMIADLSPEQTSRIAGLGIAIPGYLWEWGQTFGAEAEKIAGWRDRDIQAELGAHFAFPVFQQNDASCACGAELVFGRQALPPNFLYFYVGYFIGGGVVLNGRLYTGPTGNAGAIGPIPVPGATGDIQQLIELASLSGLEKTLAAAGGDAAGSRSGAEIWDSPTHWTMDPGVLERWMDQAAEAIAFSIATACSIIDFEAVVIDGWMPETVRTDLARLTKQKLHQVNLAGLIAPIIHEGTIGADARALGAASLPLSQRFLAL
jgi:predicted NBD/HSP70 family sugar kinase